MPPTRRSRTPSSTPTRWRCEGSSTSSLETESIAETKVISTELGFLVGVKAVADPADAALLRSKAADFLKAYRDSGAGDIPIGPMDRLRKTLSLAAGIEIPDRDVAMWTEQLGLDPWARGLEWPAEPEAERLEGFMSLPVLPAEREREPHQLGGRALRGRQGL